MWSEAIRNIDRRSVIKCLLSFREFKKGCTKTFDHRPFIIEPNKYVPNTVIEPFKDVFVLLIWSYEQQENKNGSSWRRCGRDLWYETSIPLKTALEGGPLNILEPGTTTSTILYSAVAPEDQMLQQGSVYRLDNGGFLTNGTLYIYISNIEWPLKKWTLDDYAQMMFQLPPPNATITKLFCETDIKSLDIFLHRG